MNSDDLKFLSATLGLSISQTAAALGVKGSVFSKYLYGSEPIPLTVALAAGALLLGVRDFDRSLTASSQATHQAILVEDAPSPPLDTSEADRLLDYTSMGHAMLASGGSDQEDQEDQEAPDPYESFVCTVIE